MTWVIGMNSIASTGILVSDIQVTFTKNGQKEYRDCLRKVHQLHTSVIGGFAGSVAIGFNVLGVLHREFSSAPQGAVWDLNKISNTWLPRVVRRVFKKSPLSEQSLGCQIILAGVNTKLPDDSGIPLESEVYTFDSPRFIAAKAHGLQPVTIGSGRLNAEKRNKS